MKETIQRIRDEMTAASETLRSSESVEQFRIRFLARKGSIAALFDRLRESAAADRPLLGKMLNQLRADGERIHADAERRLSGDGEEHGRGIDLSLPGRAPRIGHQHIITSTMDEIKAIFAAMGFSVAIGPEVETDFNNFEALNFPPDHPARDMQDTFFLSPSHVLRTHTTPVQVRAMLRGRPPIRIIMPGRVYRNEVISARSHVQFHQIDGLYVDRDITFADLKGTLVAFAHRFYGEALRYRFRPSFFPFTEPSAEMDITCYLCSGTGCRVCKQSGWLEILGCGMVDPNVFRAVGYDPDEVTGYAFGIGIERTAMLRHGIDDIRLLFENDLRINHQFN